MEERLENKHGRTLGLQETFYGEQSYQKQLGDVILYDFLKNAFICLVNQDSNRTILRMEMFYLLAYWRQTF